MKKKPVWKESFRLYKKNFGQLCLALLVQLILRGIALSPMLFLADQQYACLAYAAIPLYLLIALPARQNYALALQDMMNGGSVFSTQLICPKQYGKKLLRGVKGMIRILLWSVVTIVSAVLLYAAFVGHWGLDVITLMRICSSVGGGDIVTGLVLIMGGIAASGLLILLGCALHSGTRHAFALGNKKLLRGSRLRLMALWFSGLMLLVPFAAVVVYALGDYALTMLNALKSFSFPSSFALNAKQIALLIAGAVVLLFPLLPLKNLLPAVYLRMVKEERDAQA
jgi:hypothetical protein